MEVRDLAVEYVFDQSSVCPPGYQQTEVGMIPEDWAVRPLSDLGLSLAGLTYSPSDVSEFGTIVLRSSNVQRGRLAFENNVYVDMDIPARCITKEGDILICVRNGSRALIGKCARIDAATAGSAFGAFMSIFRADCDGFAFYQFQSDLIQRQIKERMGATINQITIRDLSEFVVAVPPNRTEQETIAEALSVADALIESLEQLISKKCQIKQGAMQELLTGKKRLPGFSGGWEMKRLGELGSTFGGLTGKTKVDFDHGDAHYITFMNIMTNVVIDCDTFGSVNVKPTESQNRVTKGDLFFNGSSETPEEVGMCAVLLQDVLGVFLNSFCFGFRLHTGTSVDGRYLAYYFRSREGRELLKSLAQGATRYNLSKIALLNVMFALPQMCEQSAIASVLSDIDAEIENLELKLGKARKIKQGMMQVLLTGRIRLPCTNLSQ